MSSSQASSIIHTSCSNLGEIINSLQYQVLLNFDQLIYEVEEKHGEDVASDVQRLLEPLISSPTKRVIGRLRGIRRSLDHANHVLKKTEG